MSEPFGQKPCLRFGQRVAGVSGGPRAGRGLWGQVQPAMLFQLGGCALVPQTLGGSDKLSEHLALPWPWGGCVPQA